jgi:hypothetical protein
VSQLFFLKSSGSQTTNMDGVIQKLLASDEPSIHLKTHVYILGSPLGSGEITRLQEKVRSSKRVRQLLSERRDGKIPYHPYSKWYGAHWVLAALADLHYPPEDKKLVPLREQVYEWLFSKQHLEYIRNHEPYAGPVMMKRGLVRAHASMEGNAIYYLHALGLADERTQALADRLVEWQWPDGGWNCDKSPNAHTSSFTESLLPLRGLAYQAGLSGSSYRTAAQRAAEFFLDRRLFKRKRDGRIISQRFTKLHYPCYWHYDLLFGLKVMMEAGFVRDKRCSDAIALLNSKRLEDGGFPAEEAYYRQTKRRTTGSSAVGWGGVSQRRLNEFVTCDAISVLTAVRKR